VMGSGAKPEQLGWRSWLSATTRTTKAPRDLLSVVGFWAAPRR
jgi:hypothetical protein